MSNKKEREEPDLEIKEIIDEKGVKKVTMNNHVIGVQTDTYKQRPIYIRYYAETLFQVIDGKIIPFPETKENTIYSQIKLE